MISLINIICIINLIAIVVLFILFFRNKKENLFFENEPSGYVNMLVSDADGNLTTFSMNTLNNDIQSMINKSLEPYLTATEISNNYYNKNAIENNYYNKNYINNNYYNRTTMNGSYYNKNYIDSNLIKNSQGIYLTAPGAGNNPVIVGDRIGDPLKRGTTGQIQDTLRKFTIQTA